MVGVQRRFGGESRGVLGFLWVQRAASNWGWGGGSPGSRRCPPHLRLIPRAPTSAFRGCPPRGGTAVFLLSGLGLLNCRHTWPGAAAKRVFEGAGTQPSRAAPGPKPKGGAEQQPPPPPPSPGPLCTWISVLALVS